MKTVKNDPFFENFVEPGFYLGKTEEDIRVYREECLSRLDEVYGGKKFEFNTKEDHRNNRDYYLSGIPGDSFATTGSTGKAFSFSYNKEISIVSKRYLKKKIFYTYGLSPDKSFVIYVCPFRFLEYDLYKKKDGVDIRDRYLETFIKENKKIFKEKEVVLLASNSILHKIKNMGIKGDFSLCISCLDRCIDMDTLSSFFGCKVCDWIRGSDGSLSAFSCPEGKYHVDFEVCNVHNDLQNRLVLTDFINNTEAFINYHNGDYGEVKHNNNCKCGIPGDVIENFFGRETEIFKVNNKKVYGMEIYITLFPGLGFKDCVLIQNENEEIIFYVCGGKRRDLELSKERLDFLFKNNCRIEIKNERFFDEFQVGVKKKRIIREK